MDEAEEYERNGCQVTIYYDADPPNPRTEFEGHLGTMVCGHRRYQLGDIDTRQYDPYEELSGWSEVFERVKADVKESGDRVTAWLPLYLLDHSGITISTGDFGDPWDSGMVGIIHTTRKRQEELQCVGKGWGAEKLRESLKAEVAEYDDYLTGECYGYIVRYHGEELDACWGFLGESKYCIAEANAAADLYDDSDKAQIDARIRREKLEELAHDAEDLGMKVVPA